MNAEAILNKIEEDAKETAQQMLNDANTKAEELKAASREKIKGMHAAILSQAERDGTELEQRMLRMAELEDRKELLGKKHALIEEAFSLAQEKLSAMPAKEKRAFFLRQAVRFAAGTETLSIGTRHADWFDDSFIVEANAALVKCGKNGQLTLKSEKTPDCEGLVLFADGAEIRCTVDAMLEEARADMEQQVACELFGKP